MIQIEAFPVTEVKYQIIVEETIEEEDIAEETIEEEVIDEEAVEEGPAEDEAEGVEDEDAEGAEGAGEPIAEEGAAEEKKTEPKPVPKETSASLGLGDVVIPPMDETQAELLDVKIDAIPPAMLFIPVPLAARLTKGGVDDVKELALLQRESVKKQATAEKTEAPPAPEIRVGKIDSAGKIGFKFT